MRRLATMGFLLVVFSMVFTVGVSSVSAASTCYRQTGTFINLHSTKGIFFSVTWFVDSKIIPANLTVMVSPGMSQSIEVEATFEDAKSVGTGSFAVFDGGGTPQLFTDYRQVGFVVGPCTGKGSSTIPGIADGRLNNTDLAAPAAVYCASDGGLDIYDIDAEGHGTLGIRLTQGEIRNALLDAEATGRNQLVAQWGDKQLYALYSQNLVLLGYDLKEPGKIYQSMFAGDACS